MSHQKKLKPYKKRKQEKEYNFFENQPNIKIIDTDEKNILLLWFSQYIFKKIYNGLTIYFRNFGNYIKSSSKSANSIRKWIMKFMGNNTFSL